MQQCVSACFSLCLLILGISQTITFLIFQVVKINCLCLNDKNDKLEATVLTGLNPGSGYQSSAVCLPYSDLKQIPISPKGGLQFTQHALVMQSHVTWSIIRWNFTQLLSMWVTHKYRSLLCCNFCHSFGQGRPESTTSQSFLKVNQKCWSRSPFPYDNVELSSCQSGNICHNILTEICHLNCTLQLYF